jgi:hypothetical protein
MHFHLLPHGTCTLTRAVLTPQLLPLRLTSRATAIAQNSELLLLCYTQSYCYSTKTTGTHTPTALIPQQTLLW